MSAALPNGRTCSSPSSCKGEDGWTDGPTDGGREEHTWPWELLAPAGGRTAGQGREEQSLWGGKPSCLQVACLSHTGSHTALPVCAAQAPTCAPGPHFSFLLPPPGLLPDSENRPRLCPWQFWQSEGQFLHRSVFT